jgi:hypothetical protein
MFFLDLLIADQGTKTTAASLDLASPSPHGPTVVRYPKERNLRGPRRYKYEASVTEKDHSSAGNPRSNEIR